jgi:hypothetical protein
VLCSSNLNLKVENALIVLSIKFGSQLTGFKPAQREPVLKSFFTQDSLIAQPQLLFDIYKFNKISGFECVFFWEGVTGTFRINDCDKVRVQSIRIVQRRFARWSRRIIIFE